MEKDLSCKQIFQQTHPFPVKKQTKAGQIYVTASLFLMSSLKYKVSGEMCVCKRREMVKVLLMATHHF